MAVNLSPVYGVAGQLFNNNGDPLAGGKIYTYAAGTSTPTATYTTSSGTVTHTNPIVLDGAGRVPSGEIWLTDGIVYKFVIQDAANNLIGTYDNLTGINSNFLAFTNQQEIQTAISGQTVFTLTTMQYQPGTNSLSVFVDGVNQYGPGAQYAYVETNSTTVTFTNGLHVGAEVKFTTSQLNSSGSIDSSLVTYDPPFINSVPTNVELKLKQTLSVLDFGADPTGINDSTTAIQNAVNAAQAKNGGVILIPWGTYNISSQINITGSNVVLQGYGADGLHDGGTGALPATKIVWTGGVSAGSMFSFYTVQNVANAKIQGVGLSNVYLDCAGDCGGGINIISVNSGKFDHITIYHPTYVGVLVTNYVAGQLAEACDSQLNVFSNISVRCLDLPSCINGNGFILASNSPGSAFANTSFNTYLYCQGQFANGTGFLITDADNNNLISCRAFVAGTGKALDIQGLGDSNYFYNFSGSGFPSKLFIRGIASGFAGNPTSNCFLFPDQGNGTTYPNIDPGCKIYWTGSDGTTVNSRSTQQVITGSTSTISAAQANIGLSSLIIQNNSAAGFLLSDGTVLWNFSQTGLNGDLRLGSFNPSSVLNLNSNVYQNAFSYFPNAPTSASGANAILDAGDNNRLGRSTSSAKYKTNIETLESQYSDKLLQVRPVWYRSKCESDKKEWSWYGFIAEELAEIEPRLVYWSYADDCYDVVETIEKDGSTIKTKMLKKGAKLTPESVQYDRVSVLLVDLVQRQQKKIDDLETRLSNLESKG